MTLLHRTRGRGLSTTAFDVKIPSADSDSVADAEAVALCARGDQHALEQLYSRHGATCLALARQILVDEHYAENAVHETFLELWNNAASYDRTNSSPRAYLVMLTRARAIDRVRRERSNATSVPAGGHDRADEGPGSEMRAITAALGRDAVEVLACLSVRQREALVLAFWGGYTQREIAGITATPLGTVKSRMVSGMAALSRQMVSAETRPALS